MTTIADAVEAIRQRMETNWTTTPIAWQNVAFDPDTPGGGFPAGGPFVYFEVQTGSARYASIGDPGNNLHRYRGRILAYVLVPAQSGDVTALDYARQIGTVFRGQRFSGVRCRAAEIGGGETADDEGRWWRRSLAVAFEFDERA
jgi:hypothetical protein